MAALLAPLGACSASSPTSSSAVSGGPAASFETPPATGTVDEPVSTHAVDLGAHGYVENEYFASGTAHSYSAVGALGDDGRWTVRPSSAAAYRTRIVVRRPSDPARFDGTVLVEWLNVTAGLETGPDWTYTSDEILRSGAAYIGVSVQALGVNGGKALLGATAGAGNAGLRSADPARYGTLVHPGDQYAYDIFSQVARGLRSPERVHVLGPLHPEHVIALGESQSAFFLTTFINAIEPRTHAFDGFFVHSRGGGAAPLGGGLGTAVSSTAAVHIRSDVGVPVLIFETETDVGPVINYAPAAQPDSRDIRLWEVAGTAHADAYQVGGAASLIGCTFPVNDGPEHFVAQAALHALDRWVTAGDAPRRAPRFQMASTNPPTLARDALGNVLGGVRTPAVDTPVAALSGQAPAGASVLCSLFGSTMPLDVATLVRLYHDKSGYVAAYTGALDRAIGGGFLLAADRDALLTQAEQFAFPP